MTSTRLLVAAAALCIVALVLLSSILHAPQTPHWESSCVSAHSETRMVYWPAEQTGLGITPYGVGYHLGGGMHLVQQTVCDRYDSTWVVPEVAR